MQNRKPLAETFNTAGNLLFWFVQKVNFKLWSLLWSFKIPSNQVAEIGLRTAQLIFAIPIFILDLMIILMAVIMFIISVIVLLVSFLTYAFVIKIINVIIDKAVSPMLKIFAVIFGLTISFTVLFIIYKPEAWESISNRLLEFYSLFF